MKDRKDGNSGSNRCGAQIINQHMTCRGVSQSMSRTMIIIGILIAAVGLLWPWISRLGLGRLPGDIFIQREGFTFYAPITTGILVSVVLSLILWLFSR